MEQLTKKDIEVLLEALTAWKDMPTMQNFSQGLMATMLGAAADIDADVLKEKLRTEEDKHRREATLRQETCIILSAKLIGLRNEGIVNEAKEMIES